MNRLPLVLALLTGLFLPSAPPLFAGPKHEVVAHTPEGEPVEMWTLESSGGETGLRAKVLTWGATLISVETKDREGKLGEITLGFDDPARYLQPHPSFGIIAGRYANRIAKGMFSLEGKEYTLATNNGPNHLHGGKRGFDKRIWTAKAFGADGVQLTYTSPDGEEGYPGTLRVTVIYSLRGDLLQIYYSARTDQPTVLNLTNHAYWNLSGHGDILRHELQLFASRYTVADETLIPTGELRPVSGTPLDFTTAKPIGRDIDQLKGPGLPDGYDHNFVLNLPMCGTVPWPAAILYDPQSGRELTVSTFEPGVQLYTANKLKDLPGRGGQTYGPYAGVCLETQHFPDSPNHPEFPSTVLLPGKVFRSVSWYKFAVRR